VRGAAAPTERFVLSAHVQEPGANDNASGVGDLSEMARVMAQLVNAKTVVPKRTITMIFGLEITQTNHSAGTAFVKLQEDALANPWPGLVYKLWRASHPPLGERIEFSNNYHPWREGAPLRYGDQISGSRN